MTPFAVLPHGRAKLRQEAIRFGEAKWVRTGEQTRIQEAVEEITNGFSKKLENFKVAMALHFAHYNMVRIHRTLRVTPAMAAGVSDRSWTLTELVEQTSR